MRANNIEEPAHTRSQPDERLVMLRDIILRIVSAVGHAGSDIPAWEAQKQAAKEEKAIADAIKKEEQRKLWLHNLQVKRAKVKLAKMEAQGGKK